MVKTDRDSCKSYWKQCDNPGMKNACTVVALSMTTGIPVHQSLDIMKDAGRDDGYGFYSDMFFKQYPVVAGHKFTPVLTTKDRAMNVERFIKNYPTGTYYIALKSPSHALMIKDGIVYDHTNRDKGSKIISAFVVTPTDEPDSKIKTIKYVAKKRSAKEAFDDLIGNKWETQAVIFEQDYWFKKGEAKGTKFQITSIRRSGKDDYNIKAKPLFESYYPAYGFSIKEIKLDTVVFGDKVEAPKNKNFTKSAGNKIASELNVHDYNNIWDFSSAIKKAIRKEFGTVTNAGNRFALQFARANHPSYVKPSWI